jgi:hypothetical protein
MKIHNVVVNNRKARLELVLRSGKSYRFPFAKREPRPSSKNRIQRAFVDREPETRP